MIDHLHKRGRIWWWRYRPHGEHGKAEDISLRTPDRQVAERKRTEFVAEKEREAAGIIPPKSLRDAAQKRLSEHLQDLLADLAAQGKGEKYRANIEHRGGALIQGCGWKAAKDVTADSFQTWRKSQSLSAKTLNDYLEAARRLFNWMEKHGRLVGNPLRSVEKVGTQGRETRHRRAFTDDEMKRLLHAVPDDRKAIYLLAVYTGLRRSELSALRWGDVALNAVQPFVSVRASTTKNHKSASLRLHDDAVVALRAIKRETAGDGDTVFSRFPRIERFRRDLVKAGIVYVDTQGRFADFHCLRKTFCTNLARAGVPRRTAMSLMRHSDGKLTDNIYTDENQLGTWSAVEALPSFGTLSQGLSQKLVPNGHRMSSAVAACVGANGEEVPVTIGQSHGVALTVTGGHEMGMAGVTGLEPATSAVTGQRSKPIELHPHRGNER
jgi:integrase